VGLDLGAAPGGWSAALAACGAFRRVVAADPAPLDPAALGGPGGARIEHRRAAGGDVIAELRGEGFGGAEGGLAALVCDANVRPEEAVGLLLQVRGRGLAV
jgi:hypothetical protein